MELSVARLVLSNGGRKLAMMSRHFDSVSAISYARQQLTYLRSSTWLETCDVRTLVPYLCFSTAEIIGFSIAVSLVRSSSRAASLSGRTSLSWESCMYAISAHISCSKLHRTKHFWSAVRAFLSSSLSAIRLLPSIPAVAATRCGSCRTNVMASPVSTEARVVGLGLNSSSGRGSWGLGLTKPFLHPTDAVVGGGATTGCRRFINASNAVRLKTGWHRRCPFVESAKLCNRYTTHRPMRSRVSRESEEDCLLFSIKSCSSPWASNAQSSASASAALSVPAACMNRAWRTGQSVFGVAVPVCWPTSMVPPADRASTASLNRDERSSSLSAPKSSSAVLRRIMLHVAVAFAAIHDGVWWFLRSLPTANAPSITLLKVSVKVLTSQSSRMPHSKRFVLKFAASGTSAVPLVCSPSEKLGYTTDTVILSVSGLCCKTNAAP
eukprot:PhM_4_TR1732/c2_g2_i2/m.86921